MVSSFQDEDPFAVPIDWQPNIPTFEKVSDGNSCPCPDEYQKVKTTCAEWTMNNPFLYFQMTYQFPNRHSKEMHHNCLYAILLKSYDVLLHCVKKDRVFTLSWTRSSVIGYIRFVLGNHYLSVIVLRMYDVQILIIKLSF